MPIGIRALIDFAFKKTFGSPENIVCLISLLNAILRLKVPIVDATLVNPFNSKDFQEDKLSVLDVKAVDANGWIYHIEVQLTIYEGLVQRVAYYACELFAGQLKSGDDYDSVKPVYSIWLINGIIWPDATAVHHNFRLTDKESGRVLDEILEIHTLELARYNLTEADLATASVLDCWLFWLLHAHQYEAAKLLKLLPQPAFRKATETLIRISEITEDKAMYDAREKAILDRNWELTATFREGKKEGMAEGEAKGEIKGRAEGEVRLIRTLQDLLGIPVADEEKFAAMTLDELQAITNDLQQQLRGRKPL